MDIYSTASTAIRDIYTITVFIRAVISDVSEREQALLDIQGELEHEFLFLETFKDLFFDGGDKIDGEHPSLWFETLPENFQRDVNNILCRLRRCLDSYETVALRHGLKLSEVDALLDREGKQIENHDSQDPSKQSSRGYKGRFRAKLDGIWRKVNWEEKFKGLEWALFDKDEVKKLVDQYGEWTEKLRQVMTLILLVSGRLGNYSRIDIGAEISTVLGITKAVRRQIRATSEHPFNFPPLDGTFDAHTVDQTFSTPSYTSGTFTDPYTGPTQVIIERHDFVINDNEKSEAQKRELKIELVRRLAWLLKGDISTRESTKPHDGTTPMYLLRCLGYYIMGEAELHLVYSLPPQAGKPKTLHDRINHDQRKECEVMKLEMKMKERLNMAITEPEEKKRIRQEKYKILHERNRLEAERDRFKPNLSERFYLAWALASTLYNIHASGWVHKDIWSRAILVFQTSKTTPPDQQTIPYLLGWSVSRPQTDEFRMFSKPYEDARNEQIEYCGEERVNSQPDHAENIGDDLEHEFYRHSERYRGRTVTYENKHDIYSLGIVLLEIGLWSTISMEMSRAIAAAHKSSLPPSNTTMGLLRDQILEKCNDLRLVNQMGLEYAKIVRTCLMGSFESLEGQPRADSRERDEKRDATLTKEFYEQVVEPLRLRAALI
ncbi:hypothetical protein FSARC_4760 [Fusarium sarcochroum]|uniref:Protein kinase domain-containing protein n=1 Tax=Fusarium sarcochroum TaxID=1208366 RepID=A0A8H4XAX4_9HYPO|nr:hypothetical protein FSARC_4760 [Fusarium sarcochroum]